ncbi:MAG: MipA/OmpV family protein [Pseudomonadales bacterium]|nr:MipA/OmpV family protein [Pseudomonadales bacterium]
MYLALLAGGMESVQAQPPITRIPFESSEPGSVAVGFAWRWGDSPYVDVDDIGSIYGNNSSDLVPLYLYEGKRLFAHGTEAGIHMLPDRPVRVDLIARYRLDRLEVEASEFYAGMSDRKQSLDGGVALTLEQPWGTVAFTAVSDLLARHNGEELDLTYLLPLEYGRWTFTPSASLVYQSRDLTDYYFGVSDSEARVDRPAYRPDSALFWRAGLNTSYQLSRNLQLFANVSYTALDETVQDSPLTDRDNLFASFVGGSYTLGNALPKPGEKGTWSYRINAGYTGEATFAKTHTGDLRRYKDLDSSMAGFTIGKLFNDGRRADLWGRISVNRHFQDGYQKDFFEYVAYVMAMGSGYAPWSDRELFRYGFGFGISYAERIPYAERIKQIRHGDEVSHWLNYLEAQVDFPLQNLFGKRAPRDCYIGLSLVHRSGIFGGSDMLGNTDGGSEIVTGHIECKR